MGFNPFINDSGGGGGVGPRGPKGPAGESAYEIWLDEGNTGTEQDFLDSLKGEPGPAGPQGPQGVKGETGSQGPQGEAGAAGAKGETGNGIDDIEKTSTSGKVDTYTINFTDGTTSTFSVTNGTDGQNGQPGKDGADGADGQPGQDGADGVSVTDVEVNSSNHLIVTLSDSTEVDAGEVQGRLTILTYGTSTWNDFLTAYRNSTLVYCKAYSTGSQTRLAFMAYVNNDSNPTQVEFQYYRSISNKNLSNQCDQVIIYQLDNTGTWTTTTRNTDVKFAAGDGLAANYANNTLTFAHSNSVTAKTTQGFAQIAYDAQGHITGSTAATTAQADAINSGITSTGVAQIETNKNNIFTVADQSTQYNLINLHDPIAVRNVVPTYLSDGAVTLDVNDAKWTAFNISYPAIVGVTYKFVVRITATTGFSVFNVFIRDTDGEGTNVTEYPTGISNSEINSVGTHVFEFTATATTMWIGFYPNNSSTAVTGSVTMKAQVIEKSLYDAGFTDYQPYTPSNAELTGRVKAHSEGGTNYDVINGIRVYVSATQPTGDIPTGSLWIGG